VVDARASGSSDEYPDVSVLLPTYRGDEPFELERAIDSLIDQTVPPAELFIIEDGPLTDDLESVIAEKAEEFPTTARTYRIERNQGLGNALRTGVENCTHDIVARMDADDISVPSRLERQLEFLVENPEVDIVGGQIEEFGSDPSDSIAVRRVPTCHEEIERTAMFRSPMNHGTVMFRKQTVLDAGNYRPVERMEDYDLWSRMFLDGATFANLPEVLLKVSAGERMYSQRGGLTYAREEVRTQLEFYRRRFISLPVFLFNVLSRTTLRLLPDRARESIYRALARTPVD
jgi:glycosyltransferase involved in cell wall biosynthesis